VGPVGQRGKEREEWGARGLGRGTRPAQEGERKRGREKRRGTRVWRAERRLVGCVRERREREREAMGQAAKGEKRKGEGRGGKVAGLAGPKGEKREGKERKTKQMSLSLRMKFEFKFKSK
jgi:hypothetical protein